MKKKILVALLLTGLILSGCDQLGDIGIGPGSSKESVVEVQEIKAVPTEAAITEKEFFRDDMEEDPNKNWGLKVVSGLEEQLVWSQVGGKLRLQTLPPNDTNFIFVSKKNNYKDVVITAEVTNQGPTNNAYSLVCRANADGWYEFRISSDGYYELLRFDQYLYDEGKNAYTNFIEKRLNSTKIFTGLKTNQFSLSCNGDTISAFVNGEQLYFKKRPLAIEDSSYSDGAIGFGLLGYGDSLDVMYDWVEATRP